MEQTPDPARPRTPDEELVEAYRTGTDPETAIAELYRRYGAVTLAFFRRRIGTVEIAAEQNQDLYLSVVQNLQRFRGECSFRTWLFRLARNRLGQLRRRWHVHLDEQPTSLPDDLWEAMVESKERRADDEESRGRVVRALGRCLARLSEIERAVVMGQYFHEISLREMSEMIGLSNPSGARATLLAAQRRLRNCLGTAGIDSIASEGFSS